MDIYPFKERFLSAPFALLCYQGLTFFGKIGIVIFSKRE